MGFSLFVTLLGSISVVIAWANGGFSGLDQLRRLRRAPSAQTRTEAQPRSDNDGLRLASGEGKQTGKSGERVSRPVCFPGPPVEVCPAGMPTASGRRPLQERQQLRVLAHKLKSNGDGLPRQPRRARWREGARWRSTMAVVKQLFVKPWFYAEGLKSC